MLNIYRMLFLALNPQNHTLSDFCHPINIPQQTFPSPSLMGFLQPLKLFGKPCSSTFQEFFEKWFEPSTLKFWDIEHLLLHFVTENKIKWKNTVKRNFWRVLIIYDFLFIFVSLAGTYNSKLKCCVGQQHKGHWNRIASLMVKNLRFLPS